MVYKGQSQSEMDDWGYSLLWKPPNENMLVDLTGFNSSDAMFNWYGHGVKSQDIQKTYSHFEPRSIAVWPTRTTHRRPTLQRKSYGRGTRDNQGDDQNHRDRWPVVTDCWHCILITGWWFGTFGLFSHSYWVSNHPNWLSYFSEGWPNHQPDYCWFRTLQLYGF